MYIILVLFEISSLIGLFYFSKKSLVTPSLLMMLGFFVSTICSIYNIQNWKVNLHVDTLKIVIVGMLVFILVEMFVKLYFSTKRQKKKINKLNKIQRFNIPFLLSIFIILFYFVLIIMLSKNVQSVTGIYGNLSEAISTYRNDLVIETGESVSSGLTQILKIFSSYSYISMFIFVHQIVNHYGNKRYILVIPSLLYIVQNFLIGSRLPMLGVFLSFLAMYFIISKQKDINLSNLKLKKYFNLIIIVSIVIFVFYFIKSFLGRPGEESFLDYLTRYLGGSIPSFDQYLHTPQLTRNSFWGQNTFQGIYGSLSKIFPGRYIYSSVNKWIMAPTGVIIGNTYTAFKTYYEDFGMTGLITLTALISFIFSYIYESIFYNWFYKNKNCTFFIIFYAMFIYSVFFFFFSELFFYQIFTFGTAVYFILLIMWNWIMNKVFIIKKESSDKV